MVLAVLLLIGGTAAVTALVLSSGDDPEQVASDSSEAPIVEEEPEYTALQDEFLYSAEVDYRITESCSAGAEDTLNCSAIGLDWQIQLFQDLETANEVFFSYPTEYGEVSDLSGDYCDPSDGAWDAYVDWFHDATPNKNEGWLACFEGPGGPEVLWVQEIDDVSGSMFAVVNVYGGTTQDEVYNAFTRGLILSSD